MITVLITGMGSTTAISVAKGLRQQTEVPVRIVGVDINPPDQIAGSHFCDVFHTIPLAIAPDYLDTLHRICEEEDVRVMFPIIDIELEIIARNLAPFQERGVHVWLSEAGTVLTCNDKYSTYQFFLEHDVPTPQTWLPEEVAGKEESLAYPLIVKPRRGVSSIDVSKVDDAATLRSTLERVKNPIVQEYLEGAEYTVDVVAGMDSRPLALVPRERIETKAGISTKGRTVFLPPLVDSSRRIAQTLGIRGPCNIQCRMEEGKPPKFFEVNPRFSGTLPLTIAAGVNSPLLLVKLALGEPEPEGELPFREGVYMARYWEEIFSHE